MKAEIMLLCLFMLCVLASCCSISHTDERNHLDNQEFLVVLNLAKLDNHLTTASHSLAISDLCMREEMERLQVLSRTYDIYEESPDETRIWEEIGNKVRTISKAIESLKKDIELAEEKRNFMKMLKETSKSNTEHEGFAKTGQPKPQPDE